MKNHNIRRIAGVQIQMIVHNHIVITNNNLMRIIHQDPVVVLENKYCRIFGIPTIFTIFSLYNNIKYSKNARYRFKR